MEGVRGPAEVIPSAGGRIHGDGEHTDSGLGGVLRSVELFYLEGLRSIGISVSGGVQREIWQSMEYPETIAVGRR